MVGLAASAASRRPAASPITAAAMRIRNETRTTTVLAFIVPPNPGTHETRRAGPDLSDKGIYDTFVGDDALTVRRCEPSRPPTAASSFHVPAPAGIRLCPRQDAAVRNPRRTALLGGRRRDHLTGVGQRRPRSIN